MKTWEQVETVDDLVIDADRPVVEKTEQEAVRLCPYIGKLGNFFYFCRGGVPEDTRLEFDPFNPIVSAQQSAAELQLYCMGEYENCCCYRGSLPFPGSS
jgi:hypothetical protein